MWLQAYFKRQKHLMYFPNSCSDMRLTDHVFIRMNRKIYFGIVDCLIRITRIARKQVLLTFSSNPQFLFSIIKSSEHVKEAFAATNRSRVMAVSEGGNWDSLRIIRLVWISNSPLYIHIFSLMLKLLMNEIGRKEGVRKTKGTRSVLSKIERVFRILW